MLKVKAGLSLVAVMGLFIAACAEVNVNEKLLVAAENGQLEEVKSMLEKGANVNTTDEFSRTPLMLSAYAGHPRVAAALLEAGADVDATAKYGQTALQFAREQGNTEIARMLQEAGAGS